MGYTYQNRCRFYFELMGSEQDVSFFCSLLRGSSSFFQPRLSRQVVSDRKRLERQFDFELYENLT